MMAPPQFDELLEMFRTARPTLPGRISDLTELYAHYGLLAAGHAYASSVVKTHINSCICRAIEREGVTDRHSFREDQRLIVILSVLDDSYETEPLYTVLEVLADAAEEVRPKGICPLDDAGRWRTALSYVHDSLIQFPRAPRDPGLFSYTNFTEIKIAKAARRLMQKDFDLEIHGTEIRLSSAARERLREVLARRGCALERRNAVAAVLATMKSHYDRESGTLRFPRTRARTIIAPIIPFAYCMEMALWSPGKGLVSTEDPVEAFSSLVELIRDYCCLLDIEPDNDFEHMLLSADQLSPFMRKAYLHASLVGAVQWRTADIAIFFEVLLKWLSDVTANAVFGMSQKELVFFLEYICSIGPVPHRMTWTPITPQSLAGRRLAYHANHAKALLEAFSLPVGDAPPLPEEHNGHVFGTAPLFRDGRAYFALPPSLAGPAALEATLSRLRSHKVPNVDERVGRAAEDLVRELLRAHNVNFISGEYGPRKNRRELDLAVETESTIILIEVKKKGLTRSPRADADNTTVLADIARSLLHAQCQMANHELSLRQNGHLIIHNATHNRILSLRGRRVERMAVSLYDFGQFQDRNFARAMTMFLPTLEYFWQGDGPNREQGRQLKDLQVITRRLGLLEQALHPLRAENESRGFQFSFFNISQLSLILDHVHDNESFLKELYLNKHITTGTLDFFTEYRYVRALPDDGEQK